MRKIHHTAYAIYMRKLNPNSLNVELFASEISFLSTLSSKAQFRKETNTEKDFLKQRISILTSVILFFFFGLFSSSKCNFLIVSFFCCCLFVSLFLTLAQLEQVRKSLLV